MAQDPRRKLKIRLVAVGLMLVAIVLLVSVYYNLNLPQLSGASRSDIANLNNKLNQLGNRTFPTGGGPYPYISSTNGTICTSTNGLCGGGARSFNVQINGGISTTSNSYVSTGGGVMITTSKIGNLTAWGDVMAFPTGGQATFDYAIYFSTTGIPAVGAAPNPGDGLLSSQAVGTGEASLTIQIPFAGFKMSIPAETFFVYVVFKMETIGTFTNNCSGGDLLTVWLPA